jgi:uncharacterized protein
MLPSELLQSRVKGTQVIPTRLELSDRNLDMARDIIDIFLTCRGKKRSVLNEQLAILEGEATDYRIKRGLAHLLLTDACTFEVKSPLEPVALRERAFTLAAERPPLPTLHQDVILDLSLELSKELGRDVTTLEVAEGLYADLTDNQLLSSFEVPTPESLLHRFNLAQAQGVLYRAREVTITAYRNNPGEYKNLFKYLKLFGLMTYIEGDPDHGFTITIDGPASVLSATTRYGVDLAKFLPALLHVSRWNLDATVVARNEYQPVSETLEYTVTAKDGLVSHYKKGKAFDSILEEALSKRWDTVKTDWRLEREVELVPIPGSVVIPDFRLVHPDGRSVLVEIVGYWRPEYLRKKFAQVEKANRGDLILAVSERLNLADAGVDVSKVRVPVVWFKGKVEPGAVLEVAETLRS